MCSSSCNFDQFCFRRRANLTHRVSPIFDNDTVSMLWFAIVTSSGTKQHDFVQALCFCTRLQCQLVPLDLSRFGRSNFKIPAIKWPESRLGLDRLFFADQIHGSARLDTAWGIVVGSTKKRNSIWLNLKAAFAVGPAPLRSARNFIERSSSGYESLAVTSRVLNSPHSAYARSNEGSWCEFSPRLAAAFVLPVGVGYRCCFFEDNRG